MELIHSSVVRKEKEEGEAEGEARRRNDPPLAF